MGLFTGGSSNNEVWTSNQSGLNVAAGAHFSAVEANVRVDALTGSGTISSGFNGSNTFTFGVADGSGTFAGVLSNNPVGGGLGNFAKSGAGTQILTGANTYTGTTTISGGALQIGAGGTAGSLASQTIVNNATLAFNRSDALTYGGAISGTGSLVKNGAGTLTMSGSNTYTGNTTIQAGALLVEGTLASGTVNVVGGAIGGDGAIGGSLHFGLGGGIVFDPTKTLTINGTTVTFDGFSMANVFGLDSTVALGTYKLLEGSATFDFTNVANFGAANAYALGDGKYAYFQSGSLDVLIVPEPSTAALLALGLCALASRRRPRA